MNQVGFTYIDFIPMAEITTANGEILKTTYIDRRPEIGGAPAGGSGATITFTQIIGILLRSQLPTLFFSDLSGAISNSQLPDPILVNAINERTANLGTTVEGVLLRNSVAPELEARARFARR